MDGSTPAGRLLAIFDEVREVGAQLPYREVWGAALGYSVGSVQEVEHMTEIGALLRSVYVAASAVADSGAGYDRDGLLHSYQSWCSAVFGWNASFQVEHTYSGLSVISDSVRHSLASTHGQLRGALKEGLLPSSRRDDLLSHASHIVDALIDEVSETEGLPDDLRIRLVARLVDARETISMVQYRGDQAVVETLNVVNIDFSNAAQEWSQTGQSAAFQTRLVDWSGTLRQLSSNMTQALAIPSAIGYFLATRDWQGAAVIASGAASSSTAVASAIQGVLGTGRPDAPPEIEAGAAEPPPIP